MNKLLLLDGMALVYRGYYALNRKPRHNTKGLNTSATLGFTMTLFELIKQHQPTHLAVAFDLPVPTFRHEIFPQYKANRDAMPEDIASSIPYVKQIIAAFNVPILTAEGYEADDVIGTIATKAQNAGFDRVLMVTPDKDFAQLVSDRIHLLRLGQSGRPDQTLGPLEVCEKFGVSRPEQVIDLLGLWGDTADNIPGVKGIGEKTSKKLIDQFGSVEQIVACADEIKNLNVRKKIMENAEQALFSKRLATIVVDAPIDFDEEALKLKVPDFVALQQLFAELEFNNLAKRIATHYNQPLPQITVPAKRKKSPTTDQQQTELFFGDEPAATSAQVPLPKAVQTPLTESASVSPSDENDGAVEIRQVRLCAEKALVISCCDNDAALYLYDDADSQLPVFEPSMIPSGTLVVFDLKELLRHLPLPIDTTRCFDVQLAHYLVDPEQRHSFDIVSLALLDEQASDPVDAVQLLWLMYPRLVSKLNDFGLYNLYQDVELPLVEVLLNMEREGVRIDVQALRDYSAQLSQLRDKVQDEIFQLAGSEFNIGSPKQLGEMLFERLKIIDKPPLTSTKQYSTSEEVLHKLRDRHPIVEKVLQYRSYSKLISTYLNAFPQLINPATGRLHTEYNQTVTATGRLSSSHPNLQNIPIRTELGKEIRRAFVARNDDYAILAADYSQIELRLIASLSGDENLLEAFRLGHDIHAATAARIYHIPIDLVTRDQRRNAKSVNFGIVYGISAFGLAEQLGIPRREAASLIEEYFSQYPAVREFIAQSVEKARSAGYAQTILGRRRYLPDINSRNGAARSFAERNAVNMPIQGSSADMIKIAMNNIYRRLNSEQLRTKMTLQVHDELVFDLYKPEETLVREIVEHEMTQAMPLPNIAIEVSIDVAPNWLAAH